MSRRTFSAPDIHGAMNVLHSLPFQLVYGDTAIVTRGPFVEQLL